MIYYSSVYFLSYFISVIGKNNVIKVIILTVILSIFAGIRSPYVDRDYLSYYYIWFLGADELSFFYIEPISKGVFLLAKNIELNFNIILFGFAFFSLLFKLYSVKKIGLNIASFLSIYVGYFYFQHDMTQIRLALALGFYFLSFAALKKSSSYVFLMLAIMTHISVVALLIGRFSFFKKNKSLLLMGLVTYISFLLYMVGIDATFIIKSLINSVPFLEKFIFYFSGEWLDQSINVFSFTNITFLLATTLISAFVLKFDNKNEMAINICNYVFLGLLFIPLFYKIPVISFRLSQTFLIFLPLMFAYFITALTAHLRQQNKKVALITKMFLSFIIMIYGSVLCYVVVSHAGILSPYATIFTESLN